MDLDPLLLSRWQFAFVIAFHILFPAFTIGLAAFIAVLEGLSLGTGRELYARLSRFWIRIFAVSFGMGVVSGIVMSYQFGTNWSRFAQVTANVTGPLLTYEVATAFFLEATFLGILLFGRNLVSRPIHFLSAVMVALGTLMSSFWILAANSWMHTPSGTELRDGVFHVTSWWEAVFNPSFTYRLSHMVVAAFLTTAFVVIAVGAWYLRQGRDRAEAERMFSMTLWLVTALAPLQIVLGDLHGLNTFEHQPAKVAAMEGHWETQAGAPLILFAIPDVEAERNHAEIKIPLLGSLILTHDALGEVRGLKGWPIDERPYVPIVFFAFRIMVGIGVLMLFVAAASVVLRWRGRLFTATWFHRLCIWCLPIGFVAMLAGWTTTEVGRQPWVVYGLLRTADGVSPSLTGGSVLASLIVYVAVYAIIFGAGIYYMMRLVRRGPEAAAPERAGPGRSPKRPLSVPEAPLGTGE
jgi:cytochrome d ubiquinol oxidase subunit I